MPPKVTDNRSANNESLHAVEAETAAAAQRIVATYSEDFLDAATLMCMLGVEPEGLIHRVVAELEEAQQEAKKSTRKTTKKASKKAVKKTTKKAAKKTTKKVAKKATKKTAAKKATKKSAAKKA